MRKGATGLVIALLVACSAMFLQPQDSAAFATETQLSSAVGGAWACSHCPAAAVNCPSRCDGVTGRQCASHDTKTCNQSAGTTCGKTSTGADCSGDCS